MSGCRNSRYVPMSRFQSKDTLSRRRPNIFLSLLSLFVLGPAILVFASCQKSRLDEEPPVKDEIKEEIMEYSDYTLYFDPAIESEKIRAVDILIYSAGGLKELETHYHIDKDMEELFNNGFEFKAVRGPKSIALIANSPKKLNINAIAKYSALEGIAFKFSEDSPLFPLMSGTAEFEEEDTEAVVKSLEAIISRIDLVLISNNLDDYELLESPRIRLRSLNASVNAFEKGPYFPKEVIDYGEWEELPYDIGFYSQNPETTLYCYPNWAGSSSFCTEFEIECKIRSKSRSYRFDIPTIARNSHILVELSIGEDDDFVYNIKVGP